MKILSITITILLLFATGLTLAGCSAKYTVKELKKDDAIPNKKIDGIPFRINQLYKVDLYKKNNDNNYQYLKTFYHVLPKEDKLYVLKFEAGFLTKTTANFNLNTNGTIASVSLTTPESKGADVIRTLGEQTSQITKVLEEKKIKKKEAVQKEATDRDAEINSKEDHQKEALAKKHSVEVAQAELNSLKPDASALDRLKAEQKLAEAKLEANIAYRRAGLPIPYPDISF